MKHPYTLAAAAALALAAAAGPVAASAATHAPRAGTCTVHANYALDTGAGTFTVTATSDSCSGGGQAKYQAEERCAVSGSSDAYFYGSWITSGTSTASGGGQCNGTNGAQADGYLRINMNSPVRATCWIPGDPRNGTCTAHT